MSEFSLPDDVARWPENPFELLGVASTVDEKSLKRAYQRLIRIYRPEEFPAQFRLIREAYEAALTFLRFTTPPSNEPRREPSPADSSATTSPTPAGSDSAAEIEAPPLDDFERSLAAAWSLLRDQRPAEALQLLQQLTTEQPTRHEPYLGRYWLLRMMPRTAPDRHPCDELIACLAPGVAKRGAALELYRRELERRPDEAFTPRCERLLREGRDSPPVLTVGERRWHYAAQRGAYSVIRDDLAALRSTPVAHDPGAWALLVWHAATATAWTNDDVAAAMHAEFLAELERVNDARTSMLGQLSQVEFMLETAEGVRKMRRAGFCEPFCRLVSGSWTAPPLELYVEYCLFAAPYAEQPEGLLEVLTAAGTESPPTLNRFQQFIGGLAQELGEIEPTVWTVETARRELNRFMNVAPWRHYEEFRGPLLSFCLENVLPTMGAAEIIHAEQKYASADKRSIGELVGLDRPLHAAYESLRLFEN